MLSKLSQFVKDHYQDLILTLMVLLISLFSFGLGYLAAKYQEKETIKIEFRDKSIQG
jgi:multisubunit Na+/H+ antiporter MnhC subunit